MNIFVFTIVRLIFNLLASSKLISFPLIRLHFVITGTSFSWGGWCLGWEAQRSSWHHCNHGFTRIMYCKMIVIWDFYSWKEVQVQGTCSVSSEEREDLPLVAFKLKWEQRTALSSLGEWVTLAYCFRPSLLWWQSLPDAAGVWDMPEHCRGWAESLRHRDSPCWGVQLLGTSSDKPWKERQHHHGSSLRESSWRHGRLTDLGPLFGHSH